jgi:hypothetical protein
MSIRGSGVSMGSLWTFIGKPRNRQVLSWIGGGIVAVAAGAWTVVTYVWPADETAKIVCAQQGSIAAGHNAIGNTITYNGGAPPGAGNGTTSCADATKP